MYICIYVLVITPLRGMLLVYRHETRGPTAVVALLTSETTSLQGQQGRNTAFVTGTHNNQLLPSPSPVAAAQ